MPPILHIMRHAQGYHMTEPEGHSIHDPHLTDEGKEECKAFCDSFDRHDKVELLLASPMRRAIQTCQLCFAPVVARGIRIIALPLAEEASDVPSDTGSDPDLLREEFGALVDLEHVKHGWEKHEGEYATDYEHLTGRAAHLRRWIRQRPEREVALVCHGFFAHYLTGDVNEKGEQTTGWWKDAELRTFVFEDANDHSATIRQIDAHASRKK